MCNVSKTTCKWFKWANNIHKKLIKNYDKSSDKGYILEVDIEYHKKLHDLQNGLPFLSERMRIQQACLWSLW